MSPEAIEILRKRAEAHAAACADLDNDPLIRARFPQFYPTDPPPPVKNPMQPDWLFKRQAD